jgi:hypothetical protein
MQKTEIRQIWHKTGGEKAKKAVFFAPCQNATAFLENLCNIRNIWARSRAVVEGAL